MHAVLDILFSVPAFVVLACVASLAFERKGDRRNIMESIEKLRELLRGCGCSDQCYSCGINFHGSIADKIEAEIAEKYMELPVDADGVPIHVGDYLESEEYNGRLFPCRGLNVEVCKSGKRWTVCMSYDSYSGTSEYTSASRCRHVKPRAIEDVLEDFADELHSDRTDGMANRVERLAAKYAAEIRELKVVDA